VLLAVDAGALAVFGALNPPLFACANMAVGRRIGLLAIHMGLAPLQSTNFVVGRRAVADAVGNPLLLIDIALHIRLHAL
jgi:hypothetical protein